MRDEKIWINGRLCNRKEAKVSVFDRGFLYGDGVFETMRSYAGAVFMLTRRLERLFNALGFLKIRPPYSRTDLEKAIYRTLSANGLKNAYVRITVTRGEGGFGINCPEESIPNTVIAARLFVGYPPGTYSRGIKMKIVAMRQNEFSPVSNFKTLNFLNYILARAYAKNDGFDEAILSNTNGYIAEAATSNIFLVKKGRLITPSLSCGILPGITRGVILKIAGRLRIKVKEKEVSRRELLNSDEVFLTNSLAEVLPVIKIDSKIIGDGAPGETTKLLRISYQRQVIEETIWNSRQAWRRGG